MQDLAGGWMDFVHLDRYWSLVLGLPAQSVQARVVAAGARPVGAAQ